MEKNNSESKVTCKIVKNLCVLKEYESGWRKELNLVSWNGAPAKFDVRAWTADHAHKKKGVTFDKDEAQALALYILSETGEDEETA